MEKIIMPKYKLNDIVIGKFPDGLEQCVIAHSWFTKDNNEWSYLIQAGADGWYKWDDSHRDKITGAVTRTKRKIKQMILGEKDIIKII